MKLKEPYKRKVKGFIIKASVLTILTVGAYKVIDPISAPSEEAVYASSQPVNVEIISKHKKVNGKAVKDSKYDSIEYDIAEVSGEKYYVSVYHHLDVYEVEVSRGYYLYAPESGTVSALYSTEYKRLILDQDF